MENPIDNFWKLKLENVKESLESNNFEVFIADNSVDASKIVLECDQGFVFAPKPGFQNTPYMSLGVPIHFDT